MQTLEGRRKAAEEGAQALYVKAENINSKVERASALVIQLMLLEIAASDPSITEFSFDANYEYDDEGSYFWSVSFFSDGDNGDLDPWERFEMVEQYASEVSTSIAFNSPSSFEGRITVADLQKEVAAQG